VLTRWKMIISLMKLMTNDENAGGRWGRGRLTAFAHQTAKCEAPPINAADQGLGSQVRPISIGESIACCCQDYCREESGGLPFRPKQGTQCQHRGHGST